MYVVYGCHGGGLRDAGRSVLATAVVTLVPPICRLPAKNIETIQEYKGSSSGRYRLPDSTAVRSI